MGSKKSLLAYTMKRIILVMLVAVLKLGLFTQTFAQVTIDIAPATQMNPRQSPIQ